MIIAFRSLPYAPIVPRPSRQPSHAPPWLVAESRLVHVLPSPRRGMVRHALTSIALGALAASGFAALAVILASL